MRVLIASLLIAMGFAVELQAHGEVTRGLTNPRIAETKDAHQEHDQHHESEAREASARLQAPRPAVDATTTDTLALSLARAAAPRIATPLTWEPFEGGMLLWIFQGRGDSPRLDDHVYAHAVVTKEDGNVVASTYESRMPILSIMGAGDPLIQAAMGRMRPGSKVLLHLPSAPLIDLGWIDPALGDVPVGRDEFLFIELSLLYVRPPMRDALNRFELAP